MQIPHGHQLKPSQMRAMSNADFIFHIDAHTLETFLEKNSKQSPEKYHALIDVKGLKLHDVRGGDNWHQCNGEDHHGDHDHHDHHDDHAKHEEKEEHGHHNHRHDHKEGDKDAHLWLSLHNAKTIIDYVAITLAKADVENAEIYQNNAKNYKVKLDNIDFSGLKPFEQTNFVVLHDAYQYFEKEHHLHGAGAIVIDPHLPAKPKRLSETRQKIASLKVSCIFKEPQFSDKLINTVIGDEKVHIGTLDPVGADLTPGADLYIQLIENMKNSFETCFSASPVHHDGTDKKHGDNHHDHHHHHH